MAVIACGLCLNSCSEEESGNIDSKVPFYQKYGVTFTASETYAFAHFSKNKDKDFEEIKLEGEQSIKVNGEGMEYHNIDEMEDFTYSYTKILKTGTDNVKFTFTRNKGEVYENQANKSQINAIAIPQGFKLNGDGKTTLTWIGNVKGNEETIEANIIKINNGKSETIPGEVQENGTSVVFTLSQMSAQKVTLVLTRNKQIKTTENNGTAGGEINLCYKDEQEVQIQ